jgi:hypothetical protein
MVVDPAQHGAGSVPSGDSAANIPEGHNGSGGERPENVNNEIRNQSEVSGNAGGRGGPDRSASPPGGGGDNSCRQNDRQTEARERAIMKALDLMEESNEVLQLADGHPGVCLVGQSKEDARRLLNNMKACRMEFWELRIPKMMESSLPSSPQGGTCSRCSWNRITTSTPTAQGPQRPPPRRAAPPPSAQPAGP